jgi:hypothetical protein
MRQKLSQVIQYCSHFLQWAGRFVTSKSFFYVVLGLFAFQALWIAWSGAYSMAYDEFFHLAAIQEYAKHWLPIAGESAAHPELGAFSRDPSFLYHYLMSFPYRVIVQIWHSFASQIIVLRMFNIALFTGGMVFFWRTLRRAGLSLKTANIIMFFFAFIPTSALLAAQLNYDNMVVFTAGATLYLATDIVLQLRRNTLPGLPKIVTLLAVLLAGSVVKYAFLPIAAAVGLVLLYEFIVAFRRKAVTASVLRQEWKKTNRLLLAAAGVFLLAAAGVFTERIGLNIVRYHTPVPDCAQVISYDKCLSHDAYERNENYKNLQLSKQLSIRDKVTYPVQWYQQVIRESFFAIGPKQINYPSGPPLPVANIAGNVIVFAMLLTVVAALPWLVRHPIWRLWLATFVLYVGTLFARNYSEYLSLGVPVAIHGRYVVPVIILLAGLCAAAVAHFLPSRRRRYLYVTLAVLGVLMIWGGGWLPWVIRSADSWMWPHAVPASRTLRSFLWHIVWK